MGQAEWPSSLAERCDEQAVTCTHRDETRKTSLTWQCMRQSVVTMTITQVEDATSRKKWV